MIILCSKCGERFESLIIDQNMAYKEVFSASCRHVKTKHPAMFQEMSKAIAISVMALTNFMHINEFVVVPEDEKMINESVTKDQDVVMAALGYDPGEDDEDDEDAEEGTELIENDPIEIEPESISPDFPKEGIVYPTTNQVKFSVVNRTPSVITKGPITQESEG